MSYTKHCKGKIKKYQKAGESLMDCAKRAAGGLSDAIKDESDAEDVFYLDPLDKLYIIIGKVVYEKIEYSDVEFEGYMTDLSKDGDIISFNLIYYNGGTCEAEIIEEFIENK